MIVESYEDVVILSGALRSNYWDTIHTAISLTLKRHPTGVVIDCGGITECTTEGAETFFDAMEHINRHDARIIVAAVPPQVLEVLKSVPEVRSQLPIAETVADARRSLDLLVKADAKPRRRTDPEARSKIVVCMSGESSDEYLITVARELAEAILAELVLVFPIIVPRELPLQAPLLDSEEVGATALGAAEHHLASAEIRHTVRLERARDVASAVHAALEESGASQVLVALPPADDLPDQSLKVVKSILNKIKQPVLFVRGPVT